MIRYTLLQPVASLEEQKFAIDFVMFLMKKLEGSQVQVFDTSIPARSEFQNRSQEGQGGTTPLTEAQNTTQTRGRSPARSNPQGGHSESQCMIREQCQGQTPYTQEDHRESHPSNGGHSRSPSRGRSPTRGASPSGTRGTRPSQRQRSRSQ